MVLALIDCGGGRRLERFGALGDANALLVDRPCPSAVWPPNLPHHTWQQANLRFDSGRGWRAPSGLDVLPSESNEYLIHLEPLGFKMSLWTGDHGQLGVFPEQYPNWAWLKTACASENHRQGSTFRVLNLFAYTGGSTLAAASASPNVEVTHVDGAYASVSRAMRNAEASGLRAEAVRWLFEDATKYVQNCERRGVVFDGIILDPPSFGRGGKKKKEWKIDSSLPELLGLLPSILAHDNPHSFVLLSAHSPKWEQGRLVDELDAVLGGGRIVGGGMTLAAEGGGANLPLGGFARWTAS